LAEGAFPAFLSSGSGGGGAALGVRGPGERGMARGGGLGHHVLLVESRTKRVEVESYSRSGEEEEEEEAAGIDGTLHRVPPPPREIVHVHA